MGLLKDIFIPHAGNGYAPHGLQKAAMVGMALMVVLSFAITNVQSMLWISSEWMVSTILPAVIVTETNEERSEERLGALTRNPVLDRAATLKAQHMAQEGYFAHYSPAGVSPWFWFAQADYDFVHAGENLAVHFTDSSQVVTAWMNSPTHRANIMNGQYEEIGIGVAKGRYEGFDTVFVVQLFGTPAARTLAAAETATTLTPAPTTSETLAPPSTTTEIATTASTTPPAVVSGDQASVEETIVRREKVVAVVDAVASSTPTTTLQERTTTTTPPAVPSSFMATTSEAMAATDGSTTVVPAAEPVSTWATLATQPSQVLSIIYTLVGLVVLTMLLVAVVVEIRRQEPLQVVYAYSLIILMAGMLWVHNYLMSTVLIA